MGRFLAAILATSISSAAPAQDLTSMQQMTPPSEYLATLNDQRNNPDHPIWIYIAGVVSGANIGAIMMSGRPLACGMHPVEDSEATANLILGYLIETDMILRDEATLEIAAVAAFAWRYQCGQVL